MKNTEKYQFKYKYTMLYIYGLFDYPIIIIFLKTICQSLKW